MRSRLPEIHVYYSSVAMQDRVEILDGDETIVLPTYVSKIERSVRPGDIPNVEITILGTLVEHRPPEDPA